jgi:acyl-homoserine-lactone acylase
MRKAFGGILLLLVLIAIGLAVWEPLTATRAVPPPRHHYDTIIARDTWGVPHIYGKTDADVAYGIAYAQSEDDFPTQQEVLAMTRGRLGALDGQDGAKTDYVVHLLDARATVDRDYMKQPADVRALLDGYASGMNAYARRHPREVKLAKLFPVNGQDVATGFVVRSPFFFGLDQVLGALAGDTTLPKENAGPVPDAPDFTPLGPQPGQNGSNGFVVAPKRSSDGHTRLVSNSHQPWTGGVAWYELVVHSGQGWNFAGANFPGAPYPLLGHNQFLGWTNTVNRPDLTDVYKLVLNPDGTQYRYDGQWRPLEKTRVWLAVKLWGPFMLPVPKMVYRAVQGPVVENTSGAYALRYAGADQLKMVEQYYRLNKARDFAEWQKAMAIQGVPATNFLYADAKGNIAYFYNAMFPNRKPGFDYARTLPGDTARDYAPGTFPWAMVPRNVNPASGFLENSNNTPFMAAGTGSEMNPKDWSPLLGIETDTTNRSTRALELLGSDPSISAADLYRIKYDVAVSKRSWAGKWFGDIAAVDSKGDKALDDAKLLLSHWDWSFDGRNSADSLATLLFHTGQSWHYFRKPEADPRQSLKDATVFLMKYYGRLDPPYNEVVRLRRGTVDLPMDGGPDTLRAAADWDVAPDGRLVVKHGDSFIMFVDWDKAGNVTSQSIQPFGAAVSRPHSRHYADQAPLFVKHQLKPVWFSTAELQGHVERVYRP